MAAMVVTKYRSLPANLRVRAMVISLTVALVVFISAEVLLWWTYEDLRDISTTARAGALSLVVFCLSVYFALIFFLKR